MEINELIEHVINAYDLSDKYQSKLTEDILLMEGMSGRKTRHLYNNLCNLDNINYLEVGSWKGSSFISALYGNNVNAIAIDNWSEFEGNIEDFTKNTKKYLKDEKFSFIEKDCFLINKDDLQGNIDIYLYDGNHDYDSQKKAITHYYEFLSKYSVIIIDDWRDDWTWIKEGTYKGIEESGLIIRHKIEKNSTQPDDYWNGFCILVCEKK